MHVPAEAEAGRPLRLGQPDVGHARCVVVGELVVAQAEVQQQVGGDLPVVLDVLGSLGHEHGGDAEVDVSLHVVAVPVMALGRRGNVGWNVGIDAEHRLAGIALPVDPFIARPGVLRTVVDVPRVDVVDADLEVMVAQPVVEAQPVVRDRLAMLGIRDRRVRLRVADAPWRDEGRVLHGSAGDMRQVGIEPRIGRLLREVLAVHFPYHRVQGQVVGEVGGVVGRPHVESGLVPLVEAGEITALQGVVVEVVEGSRRLVRVLEAGQRQHVAVIDVPVQLGVDLGVPGGPRFGGGTAAELRGRLVMAVVLLGSQEEEQLVPDERAADVGVVDRFAGAVALAVHGQIAGPVARIRLQRIGVVVIDRGGLQACRLPQCARPEMPLVGAALADLVDHAADGAAVLGVVTAGESLLLLDGAVRQGDAALVVERLGDVHAVDVVRVLGRRGATEHVDRGAERAARELGRAHVDARRQHRDVLGGARQRQLLQLPGRDRGDLVGRAHVDRRKGVGRDVDRRQRLRVGGRLGGGREIHGHRARRHRTDVAAALHDLAILQQGNRIGADRKGDRIFSGCPHRDGAVETRSAGDLDGFADSHRYRAVDGAAGRLCPGRAGKTQGDGADGEWQRLALQDMVAM